MSELIQPALATIGLGLICLAIYRSFPRAR